MIDWKTLCVLKCFLAILSCCEGVNISVPSMIFEGEELFVNCTSAASDTVGLSLSENGILLSVPVTIVVNLKLAIFQVGNVSRADSRDNFTCFDARDDSIASSPPLNVIYSGGFTIASDTTPEPTLGGRVDFAFTIDANPAITNATAITLLKDGVAVSGDRYSVGLTSARISNVVCSDSGNYTFQVVNSAGEGISSVVAVTVRTVQPTSNETIPLMSVGLSPTNIDLASYISACPNEVMLSCSTSDGTSLPPSTIDVDNSTREPLVWKRSDFTTSNLNPNTVQVTCIFTNTVGSTTESFTVMYDSAPCGEVQVCLAAVLASTLTFGVLVAIIVAVVIVLVVIKKPC